MNKKIAIICVIFVFIISASLAYFDRVVLQKRVKTLVINEIESSTGKKCAIRSINFNIFKGVVIRDLIVSDNNIAIFNSKEVSCSFLVLPLLKKEVIISSLRFRSPEIFLQRRNDNSVSMIDLISKNKTGGTTLKLLVSRISLRGGSINFRDDTLVPPFTKKINNLNANIYFSVPAKVRFNFEFGLQDDAAAKINASGEYQILKKELKADVDIKDLSPAQLSPYYSKSNFSILEGTCDATMNLVFKNDCLAAGLRGQMKGLVFQRIR